MERLKYEEIDAGWDETRVVVGYEVTLSDGWRGVGTTLDEAKRAAEHARGTHQARRKRMEREARVLRDERMRAQGHDLDDSPF